MARTKVSTAEEKGTKQQAVKPVLAPILAPKLGPKPKPETKVNFKNAGETPEELRPAPKGVSGTRERKLMAEPVYEQGDGVTKKTISQRSVIIEPKKATLTAQSQPQPQPQQSTRGALVADARAKQARAITEVKAGIIAGQGRGQDATTATEQRAKIEARQKCSQSCQAQFRNNAARLGECLANCV